MDFENTVDRGSAGEFWIVPVLTFRSWVLNEIWNVDLSSVWSVC